MAGTDASKTGIYAIAIFEAVKGALGLAAGFAVLSLVDRNLAAAAEQLIDFLHIDHGGRLAQQILETVLRLTPSNMTVIFGLSLAYAAARFIEAYGLWRLRDWARWFGIVSGLIYVPVEIYEIFQRPTVFRAALLLINLGVVLYLYSFRRLRQV